MASPCSARPAVLAGPPHPGLKILISTWNMGDSIPKGDLEVLYGAVPPYIAPPPTVDRGLLPDFGATQGHPYHLIVIAAQECPTQSGVPRGIAAGVTKGMYGERAREKLKEKEKMREVRERVKELGREAGLKVKERGKERERTGSGGQAEGDVQRTAEEEVASGSPSQGGPHHGHHAVHVTVPAKGWSDILEDYFCHGIQTHQRTKASSKAGTSEVDPAEFGPTVSITSPTERSLVQPLDRDATPTHPILMPRPARHARLGSTSSIQHTIGSVSSAGNDSLGAHEPQLMLATSPNSLVNSPLPTPSLASVDKDFLGLQSPPTTQPSSQEHSPVEPPAPRMTRKDLPDLIISSSPPTPSPLPKTGSVSKASAGPYQFLMKERLLGLYVAIFVHKDCAHFVEGHDKDYVPAGLVGGRMGNKGGIGVSLSMAGHRMLFVNAHLAAHTTKLNARLANMAKIRSELHLDTFLPHDDPRAEAENIEDRYDTVFWFGDLNFRLEVSRLHADWLIARKEYDQALQFDQLRHVMEDEQQAVARYSEAPINFPPTFKYDVWRSVKRQRSTRRSGTVTAMPTPRPRKDQGPILEEVAEDGFKEEPAALDTDGSEDDDASDLASTRRVSMDSSAWNSTAGNLTDNDHGMESEGEPVYTVQQPPRPISEVAVVSAIKVKHKFLNILKGNSGRSSTASSTSSTSPGSRNRALSRSSMGSERPRGYSFGVAPLSTSPDTVPSIEPAVESAEFKPSNPSRPRLTRNMSSKFKRRLSIRGQREESSGSSGEEDTREGVYDSSAKQRVPSWCDRVLWTTHVYPDPEPEMQPPPDSHEHSEGRLGRIGAAISGAFHRRTRERAMSGGDAPRDVNVTPPVAGSGHGPQGQLVSPSHPGSTGNSRRPNLINRSSSLRFASGTKLTDAELRASPEPDEGPRQAIRMNSSPINSLKEHARLGHRSRANSADIATLASARQPHSPPASPRRNTGSTIAPPVLSPERTHGVFPRARTIGATGQEEGDSSGRLQWLKDLSNTFLHGQRHSIVSLGSQIDTHSDAFHKHLKGEVECLKYGTLDDAGMRKLEGRSDHRPIVFAALVYV